MSRHLVFVYGTLKAGLHNHLLLEDQHLISSAETVNKYVMYDGGFPVVDIVNDLFDDRPRGHIKGELYLVDDDCFKNLDSLEGYPTFYTRMCVDVVATPSAILMRRPAWMYFGLSALDYRDELMYPDDSNTIIWPKMMEERVA